MANPPIDVRLKVLAAIDYAEGHTIRDRIKTVSQQVFTDTQTGRVWQFTWRTISTWFYRYKKRSITTLERKSRRDKHQQCKVTINELAEAIHEVLPTLTKNIAQLNQLTQEWIEHHYNHHLHSAIQMTPLQRFNLDHDHITYLLRDDVTDEVFFIEQDRKVSKVNVFSIHNQQLECPVDLRGKTVQVRYDRHRRDRFIVYYRDKRMGEVLPLNLYFNARTSRQETPE